ncbi:hypothetical protein MAPG_10159 [Magnaporthiopsis poae ATCC 64411]|uniref:Uncharacterized protein n=1 Tax=Magnaporthiopsis poae (strain ATCC 64411 / 73-15) TaxID=644358 RepID=A0A0C4EBV0_MAGP6|nr:hypothetical protein MAPG_10159 [Magnaporthiopsis poae ATCC 64411]
MEIGRQAYSHLADLELLSTIHTPDFQSLLRFNPPNTAEMTEQAPVASISWLLPQAFMFDLRTRTEPSCWEAARSKNRPPELPSAAASAYLDFNHVKTLLSAALAGLPDDALIWGQVNRAVIQATMADRSRIISDNPVGNGPAGFHASLNPIYDENGIIHSRPRRRHLRYTSPARYTPALVPSTGSPSRSGAGPGFTINIGTRLAPSS